MLWLRAAIATQSAHAVQALDRSLNFARFLFAIKVEICKPAVWDFDVKGRGILEQVRQLYRVVEVVHPETHASLDAGSELQHEDDTLMQRGQLDLRPTLHTHRGHQ